MAGGLVLKRAELRGPAERATPAAPPLPPPDMTLFELVQSQAAAQAAASSGKEGPAFRFENMGLGEIPDQLIDALVPHNPSKLSFQANHLTSLPDSLRRLQSLYYLDISSNNITSLPGVVCDLQQLEILDISDNGLHRLPAELARLKAIQVISLQANRVEYVPPVLADLPNLTFVELDENPLIMPPRESEDKNDIEWLTAYISVNRPMLEARNSRLRSASDGRKRMGLVMDEQPPPLSAPPSPGSPAAAPLQPSPLMESDDPKEKVGERLVFALRRFLRGVDQLGLGPGATSAAGSRVADLAAALDAGFKFSAQCSRAVAAALELCKLIQENCLKITQESDIALVRSLILDVFHAFYELQNAWNSLGPAPFGASAGASAAGGAPSASNDHAVADDMLYNQLSSATASSRHVLSLLNDAISRSAVESARAPPNQQVTLKVRDLSNVCITGVAATRRLSLLLDLKNSTGSTGDREKFWEAVNEFLKSIIAILGAAKSGMDSLPLLVEVRPQISTLARVAKEIPPLLEQSSFKMGNTSPRQSTFALNPPRVVTTLQSGSISPSIQMPTPLTATLGSAAQVVMSPGIQQQQQQSPFFQDFRG